MEYELAKELKEELKNSGYKGKFYLSSLIDACDKHVMVVAMKPESEAFVVGSDDIYKGKTPHEAVAYLWIALNKK